MKILVSTVLPRTPCKILLYGLHRSFARGDVGQWSSLPAFTLYGRSPRLLSTICSCFIFAGSVPQFLQTVALECTCATVGNLSCIRNMNPGLLQSVKYFMIILCIFNFHFTSPNSLGCMKIPCWKRQFSSCCPGAATSRLKPAGYQVNTVWLMLFVCLWPRQCSG